MDAIEDNRVIAAQVAARTRLESGRLLIDEIVGRANFIREARKAKWTPEMIEYLEDYLVSALKVFSDECRRVEEA